MHDAGPPVTNNSKTDTDLPLLPGGNNGNRVGDANVVPGAICDLLRDACQALPEPPVELLDEGLVLNWVERAGAALLLRRDRQRLLREAMRILDDDWRTAMATNRLRRQFDRQQGRIQAKAAGTYWRDRDGQRRAKHPAHVVVDRDAWNRAKIEAVAHRSSVGVLVGELVIVEVRCPRQRHLGSDWHRDRRGEIRLFARLAVSKEIWAQFRSLARRNEVTIERFVGALVEDAFPSCRGGR